ncbi:MAG: archaemetzincin family Zn-dependent metalloprotease [Aquificaceae bacterium]
MFIYLVSFGEIENRLILATAKNIKETFGFDVRISSIPIPLKKAYNPERGQYKAGEVLKYLSDVRFPELLKLVALLSFDIYEDGFNFVFGLSQLGGRIALVSLLRLRSYNELLFFERTFKEVNHELGHTFGLGHCKNKKCVMNFSLSVEDVDAKGKEFCQDCKKALCSFFEKP